MTDNPLLSVDGLTVAFSSPDGPPVAAVQDLSFSLNAGETLCIVGESGCGKSLTALSLMRLLPRPHGMIGAGRIMLEGRDIATASEADMRMLRGRAISMIFQEPMTSLNPVLTIGSQISEMVKVHEGLDETACRQRALDMLKLVRIPEPERRMDDYPHQLSGGMRQRVMIAMALVCDPKILLADEPTTALDVTIEAQILELIQDLKQRTGTAVILITHDFGVVAEMADRVLVMYAGRQIEQGTALELFDAPTHPYTQALMAAMPRFNAEGAQTRLKEIAGIVPALHERGQGCCFAPRCEKATRHCFDSMPPLRLMAGEHSVACWHAGSPQERHP